MEGSNRLERKDEVEEDEEAFSPPPLLDPSGATADGDKGPEEKLISSSPSNVAMALHSAGYHQMEMDDSFCNVTSTTELASLTLTSSVTRPRSI